jgi:hypothetical protein
MNNILAHLPHFARARLLERSTWRGLVLLLAGLGISVDPAHIEALSALAAALIGALEIFQPDHAGRMDSETVLFDEEAMSE